MYYKLCIELRFSQKSQYGCKLLRICFLPTSRTSKMPMAKEHSSPKIQKTQLAKNDFPFSHLSKFLQSKPNQTGNCEFLKENSRFLLNMLSTK